MKRSAGYWIGIGLISAVAAMALTSMVWTPYPPLDIEPGSRLLAPGVSHWLGTDEFGRDVLSRIMVAGATSLLLAALTICVAILVGVVIGAIAGFFNGPVDRTLMVLNDAMLAFPNVLFAFGVIVIAGPSKYGIVLGLGAAYAPTVARMVRGTVVSLRGRAYVESSRIIGNSAIYTLLHHVLPNCTTPILMLATSLFGWIVLAEGTLNFLGLGVPPPAPTWGNMLASGRPYIEAAPWLCLAPGLSFAMTLLGINLLGDALRDRLDPRKAHT